MYCARDADPNAIDSPPPPPVPPSKMMVSNDLPTFCLCLCSSYQLLDDMVDRARDADPVAIERIPDLLQYTRAHVNSFESLIERCLDLPVSNLAPSVTNDS